MRGREFGLISWATVRQFSRYLMVAAVSACVTMGVPFVLHEGLDIAEEIAVAVAFSAAFAINFWMARRLVFRSAASVSGEAVRFLVATAGFRVSEYVVFLLLHTVLGIHYLVALFGILAVFTVLKYVTHRYLVFGRVSTR